MSDNPRNSEVSCTAESVLVVSVFLDVKMDTLILCSPKSGLDVERFAKITN